MSRSTTEPNPAYFNCFSSSQRRTHSNKVYKSTLVPPTQLFVQLKQCYLTWQVEIVAQALFSSPRKEKSMFRSALQSLMGKMKLNRHHYNTHSFRIGAATSASPANISDTHIQMLGRWRSNAFQRYIRPPPTEVAKVSKSIATGNQ